MKNEVFEKPIIILTGQKLYERITQCYKKNATFVLAESLQTLSLILRDNIGVTVLLDLKLFDDDVDHPMVKILLKKGTQQRIIVITDEQDPAKLYPLMEQGARGICCPSMKDELLLRAIQAVNEGELWIGRQFVSYLIGKMMLDYCKGGEEEKAARFSGISLTAREQEIATHVAQGKCDKLIARDLNISPNTVKNHLSNIFKKLHVTDRFQLALIYHGIIGH